MIEIGKCSEASITPYAIFQITSSCGKVCVWKRQTQTAILIITLFSLCPRKIFFHFQFKPSLKNFSSVILDSFSRESKVLMYKQ